MLISEVWDKVEYLEMHEGKLKLKKSAQTLHPNYRGDGYVRPEKTVFSCLDR